MITGGVSLAQLPNAEATTLLVDIQAGGGLTSTAADFKANDPNVDTGSSVNYLTALTSTVFGAFTVNPTGGGGLFNTINGAANDDIPIIDGYWWTFGGVGSRNLTVSGLSSISSGQTITVVLYGASDSDTTVSSFLPTYDGSALEQKAAPLTGSRTVSYSFTSTGADTLSIAWGRTTGSGGAGLGGFSLTAVPEPSTMSLAAIFALSASFRRRRHGM